MLRIKNAQFGDIDRAVEQARARYVEDTYRRRYMQGTEEFEIWGRTQQNKTFLASEDPFQSAHEAKAFALKYLDEFKEQGFVELWVAVEGGSGEMYEPIWSQEE